MVWRRVLEMSMGIETAVERSPATREAAKWRYTPSYKGEIMRYG